MKKTLICCLVISVTMIFLSLLVVRVDLSYHDYENGTFYDLKDEFFFYKSKSNNQAVCDVICSTQRGYPLPMTNSPYLHDDIRFIEMNIILNLSFYLFISIIVLSFYHIISIWSFKCERCKNYIQ